MNAPHKIVISVGILFGLFLFLSVFPHIMPVVDNIIGMAFTDSTMESATEVAIGTAFPYLVLVIVIGGGLWWIWRMWRKEGD